MAEEKPYNPNPKWNKRNNASQEDVIDSFPFFDIENQKAVFAQFINFCLKDGNELALPMNDLEAVRGNPAKEVILFFGLSTIFIRGRNLRALYRHILSKKIKEIRAYARDEHKDFEEEELFITEIMIETNFLE